MANLTLVTAGYLSIEESIVQMTGILAEDATAGDAVRLDVNGRFTKANATTAANSANTWILAKSGKAGEGRTVIKLGVLDGFDLSALAYGADVFLSNTGGALADAAGTTSKRIGQVIPAFAQTLGNSPDKLLLVELV